MTINYQFGDVDAHGAMIRALAGLLEAEHQAIISDVLTASDFWGGAGSAACQGFITQLGRNFQVIYDGLRGVTAGDQFGPYVLRSGVGADAGCGRGLGRGGRGVGVGCDRLCVGDSRADRCAVGGCGVVVDGGGGHAVCGLAEPSRGAGRAGGDAGRGGRGGL